MSIGFGLVFAQLPQWTEDTVKSWSGIHIANFFGTFTFTGSNFLTVLLSIERYLVVCKGKKLELKKTLYSIGFISLFAFIYALPFILSFQWEIDENGLIVAEKGKLACNKIFVLVYGFYLNNILRLILPMICLIVFNILILREVKTWINFDNFNMYVLPLKYEVSLLNWLLLLVISNRIEKQQPPIICMLIGGNCLFSAL